MAKSLGFRLRKCEYCGKEFEAQPQWGYRKRISSRHHDSYVYFCSYKCMRKDEEENER